uniref:Uncharacterized protein n=1 Tax=Arundo donax TaxID=35708 RepID=A0A0A9HF96_ARUDO
MDRQTSMSNLIWKDWRHHGMLVHRYHSHQHFLFPG